ncbi:protein retrieval receptor [Saccharomyces cerevisiae]|nr:protein retrieval receptor [Saccharomyces cerevisiae]
MDYDSSDTMNGGSSNPLITKMNTMKLLYQHYLDKVTPHAKERWAVLGGLLCLFMVRITMAEGWYVICYGLGLFLLNQFLAFLTPKFDMSLQQDEENNELEAGEKSEEFRPFIRRLPEFKFWYNSIRATVISLLLSLFSIFDIPVFWPILLIQEGQGYISEKLFKTKKNEMIRKTVTNLVAVRLKNLSHEFDVIENYLRYIASTSEHQFTAIKRHFNKCARKLLKEAIDSKSNSETATVVLQERFSGICLLKASSIILKLKLKFPKKKDRTDISKLCDKKERMTQWLEISILMN